MNDQRAMSLNIKAAEFEDLGHALQSGWRDFLTRPMIGMFFGGVYALSGLIILISLLWHGQIWYIIPLAIGFPLIAPFIAAGLYDVSRRLQQGESFSFSDVLTVMWHQQKRELSWMAFTVLFVFWIWMYQVRLLLALFLQKLSFSSVEGLADAILFTNQGWAFLAVGTGVGALLSAVLFSATVISMPLLLDRNVDFVTAMVTSFRTVSKSPVIMLGWGAAIAIITILSMVPAFLGLIIVLPVLGHATWHLYQRLVSFS